MNFMLTALLSAMCIPAVAWAASPECAESPGGVISRQLRSSPADWFCRLRRRRRTDVSTKSESSELCP